MAERDSPRDPTGFTPAPKKIRIQGDDDEVLANFGAQKPQGREELGAVLSGLVAQLREMELAN